MQPKAIAALGVAVLSAAGPTAAADVRLSFHDGRVSLVAVDATVAEILSEWARAGNVKVINADRIPAEPVTLDLEDIAEASALDVLLRSASGYVAASRRTDVHDGSVFDRIVIMPPSVFRPAAAALARSRAVQDEQVVAQANPGGEAESSIAAPSPPADEAPPPAPPPAYGAAMAAPYASDFSGGEENGAVAPPSANMQAAIPTRRALETVNPRTFQELIHQQRRSVPPVTPQSGVPRPVSGVPTPGAVPRPPRQPGESK